MTDLSKIKPGDEVTVWARVEEVRAFSGGAELLVAVDEWRRTPSAIDCRSYVGIKSEQIVEHHPRALSIGDRVKVGTGRAEVIAIHGKWAWLMEDGGPITDLLDTLERV